MYARIEPLTGIIRVWVDTAKYKEPYEWCATVRYIQQDIVEILGYTKKVTPSIWKAVIKECQRRDIKKILAVSYPHGVRKEKWIMVPSPFQELYR
jgi:hypothetical protein